MNSHLYQWRKQKPSAFVLVGILTISIAQTGATFVGKVLLRGELYYDAREYWYPIARGVSEGQTLYVQLHDNKPPLFFYINQLVYSTGHYKVVFYFLLALVNALAAFQIYYWLDSSGYSYGAVAASVLFISSLPLVRGTYINVRSLSIPFLIAAVIVRGPRLRGGLLGVATMISQFSAFAIPILLLDGWLQSRSPRRWVVECCATGLLAGGMILLPLYIVWGPAAVAGAISDSFLSAGQYSLSHNDPYNPFINATSWAEWITRTALDLGFFVIPLTACIVAFSLEKIPRSDEATLAIGLTASFSVSLLLHSVPYYWIPIVAFGSCVVGMGLEEWAQR